MLSDPQKRAAYDQYGHAGVDPNLGGRGGAGRLRRLRRGLRRHLRRHLRRRRRGARRGGGQQVYRGSDLSYAMEITLEEAAHGKETQIRIPTWDDLRDLQGQRRQAGHQPDDLHHLPRLRHGADAPGLLQHPADLPALPRQRQDHSRALHHLPRPGPDQEEQDARGQDSRRHQRRHAHPLERQRRAGHRTAARTATSTSRSGSSSTRSSSATATTCTARCRSA